METTVILSLPSPVFDGLDDEEDDDNNNDEHTTPQDVVMSLSPSGVAPSGANISGISLLEIEGPHLRFAEDENEDDLHREFEIQNQAVTESTGSPNLYAADVGAVQHNIPTVITQTKKKKRTSKVLLNVKNMFRSTMTSQTMSATPSKAVTHEEDSAHMLLSQGAVVPDSPPSFRSPDIGHPKRTLKDRISMLRSTNAMSPSSKARTPVSTTSAVKAALATHVTTTPRAAVTTTTTTTEEGSESMTSGSPAHQQHQQLPQQMSSPMVRRSPVKTLRRFMTLPPRDKDLPVRYSKRKEKEARQQARRNVLHRVGGALGESPPTLGPQTSDLDSGLFFLPESNDSRNIETENYDDFDDDQNHGDEELDGIREFGADPLPNTAAAPEPTTKKTSKGGALSKIRKKALNMFQSSKKPKDDAVPHTEFIAMMDMSSGSFAYSSTQMLIPISPYKRDAPRPSLGSKISDGSPAAILADENEEDKTVTGEVGHQVIENDQESGGVQDGQRLARHRQGNPSPTRSDLKTVEHEQRRRGHTGRRRQNSNSHEVADSQSNGDKGAGKGSLSPPRNPLRRSKSLPKPNECDGTSMDGKKPREKLQDNPRHTRSMRHKSHGPVGGPGRHAVDGNEAIEHDNSRRTRSMTRKSQSPVVEVGLDPVDGSEAKEHDNSRRTRFMKRNGPGQVGKAGLDVDGAEAKGHDHSRRTRFVRHISDGVLVEETSPQYILSPRTRIRRSMSWTKDTESVGTTHDSDRRERTTNPRVSCETQATVPRRRIRRIHSNSGEVDCSARSEQEVASQDRDLPHRRRLRSTTSKSPGTDGETDHGTSGTATATARHRRLNSLNKGISSARSERKGDLGYDQLSPKSPSRRRRLRSAIPFVDGESTCITPRSTPKENPCGVRHRIKRSNSRGSVRSVSPSKNSRAFVLSQSPTKRGKKSDDPASLKALGMDEEHQTSRIRRTRESISPVKTLRTQVRCDSPVKRRPMPDDAVGALSSSKRYEGRKTRRSPPRTSGSSSRTER